MNASERIYETLARDGTSAPLRSETLARRIEDDIASGHLQAGDSLGSVRALAERYGAGRSSVCEAIRILERRGLGRMRTGRSGGLILSRPGMDNTAEELADFTRLTGITRRQLLDAREAVDGAAACLAADLRPSPAELARITEIAASSAPPLQRELAMRTEVARLSGNAALRLFVQCLNSLTLDFAAPASASGRPARIPDLALALADGDAAGACGVLRQALDHLEPLLLEPAGTAPGPGCAPADTHENRSTGVARAILEDLGKVSANGGRLGSEWELCERYGVGRLILRQAIRMLEDRGLVECRRGRGQGLLARSPQPYGAVRQTVAFLMAEDFAPQQIGQLLCLLNLSMPALAVARADDSQRRRLVGILQRQERRDPVDRAEHLELVRCVADLSDVPIVDLFCRSLVAYEARVLKNLPDTFPRGVLHAYLSQLRRLIEAGPLTGEALNRARAETAAVMLEISRCAAP